MLAAITRHDIEGGGLL